MKLPRLAISALAAAVVALAAPATAQAAEPTPADVARAYTLLEAKVAEMNPRYVPGSNSTMRPPAAGERPFLIGMIEAPRLIARGCTRNKAITADHIRMALDARNREMLEDRGGTGTFRLRTDGGDLMTVFLAELHAGCPAPAPAAPSPATPALDKARALDLLARLRAVIEGAR